MQAQTIQITTPFIRLDALLKFAALVGSGGEAKAHIADGAVFVNGEPCSQRGRKLYPGDRMTFDGCDYLVAGEN